MSTVSKVIFESLARRRSVVLPGVGSLEVKRRMAKKISDTRIIPPQNVVIFTSDELADADSVITLLVSAEEVSKKEARALYESWLEGARSGGEVTIENVGEISGGRMVISGALHNALNPAKEEDIITMETEKRAPMWAWVLIGILLAALVFLVLWNWQKGHFAGERRGDVEVVSTPFSDPMSMANLDPSGEGIILDDGYSDTGLDSGSGAPTEPRYHVIAGSFSVESNADNFIAKIRRDFPDLTVEKIVNPRNGYNMVSIYSAPTESQAYNKMNLYWDVDLYLWIYEQK